MATVFASKSDSDAGGLLAYSIYSGCIALSDVSNTRSRTRYRYLIFNSGVLVHIPLTVSVPDLQELSSPGTQHTKHLYQNPPLPLYNYLAAHTIVSCQLRPLNDR